MSTELISITPDQTSSAPSLLEAFSDGPSSLIANQVIESIDRLKQENIQPKVWQLFFNPAAGYNALQAITGEASAHANAKRIIAQTVKDQVEIAGQDVKRDTLLAYINSLQKNIGHMLPGFCQDHGIDIPRSGSVDEMMQLIKLNFQIVSVNEYQQKLQEAMNNVFKKQADLKSKQMLANIHAQELPNLITNREKSYPLQRQVIYQKTGQIGSLFGGIPAAFTAAVIVGLAEGSYWGGQTAVKFFSEKIGQAKQGVKSSWNRTFHT